MALEATPPNRWMIWQCKVCATEHPKPLRRHVVSWNVEAGDWRQSTCVPCDARQPGRVLSVHDR